jgi:hypothetical protein
VRKHRVNSNLFGLKNARIAGVFYGRKYPMLILYFLEPILEANWCKCRTYLNTNKQRGLRMKRALHLLTAVVLLAVGTACIHAQSKTSATATVVVFRNSDAADQAYTIRSNQQIVGELHAGERIVLNIPVGTYQLAADEKARQRFFVEAKANDTLFIHVDSPASQGDSALLQMSSLQSFIQFAPGPR